MRKVVLPTFEYTSEEHGQLKEILSDGERLVNYINSYIGRNEHLIDGFKSVAVLIRKCIDDGESIEVISNTCDAIIQGDSMMLLCLINLIKNRDIFIMKNVIDQKMQAHDESSQEKTH